VEGDNPGNIQGMAEVAVGDTGDTAEGIVDNAEEALVELGHNLGSTAEADIGGKETEGGTAGRDCADFEADTVSIEHVGHALQWDRVDKARGGTGCFGQHNMQQVEVEGQEEQSFGMIQICLECFDEEVKRNLTSSHDQDFW